jgi:hypothetical protein
MLAHKASHEGRVAVEASAGERTAFEPLRDFAAIVAVTTSLAAALIAWTPLLTLYLGTVIGLAPELHPLVRFGLQIGCLLPALTALTSRLRGMLVGVKLTGSVYRGMGVNLAVNVGLLLLGVALGLPGILVAAAALVTATVAEYGYLLRRFASVDPRRAAQPVGRKPAVY